MISAADIGPWLQARMGTAFPADCSLFNGGGDIVWTGPRFIVVTDTGGPGLEVEGAFDVITVQVRIAGRGNDYTDALALADAVDDAFLTAPAPVTIAGRYVMLTDRVGGRPSFDRRDNAGRTHLTGNYLLHVAR